MNFTVWKHRVKNLVCKINMTALKQKPYLKNLVVEPGSVVHTF